VAHSAFKRFINPPPLPKASAVLIGHYLNPKHETFCFVLIDHLRRLHRWQRIFSNSVQVEMHSFKFALIASAYLQPIPPPV